MNNNFTITLGRRHAIEAHGAHEEQDFKVTLVETGQNAMTGARVKRVEPFVDGDLFLVTYGDTLADVDLRELVAFHRRHGKLATVTAVHPVSRFGILSLDECGGVVKFTEKPVMEGYANAGFFVFDRRVFEYLDADDSCILERRPLERLADDGQLVAYCHDGFFFAMDTYREYLQLNEMWNKGQAPWKVWK
jgi:glucose-1-phosphate cytidylyltransferase